MKKFIYVVCLLGIISCSDDSSDDITPTPTPPTNSTDITYNGNIKAIIDGNCIGCHGTTPTNGANSNLTNYTNVKNLASNILTRISKNAGESGAMPAGGPRLSQSNIDLVEDWINDGLLEQ